MKKTGRYTFRVDEDVKDRFKIYCKVMGVSPSDLLEEVMINFNDDVDKIIQMQSADELRAMLQGKFSRAENEIHQILEEKKKNQQ